MDVFIALQKDVVLGGSQNKTVAVQKCGDPPYEIALRMAGCVLQYGLCFASGYAWPAKFQSSYRVKSGIPVERLIADFEAIPSPTEGSYNWMRILGGEPILNDAYVNYVFDFIIAAATTMPEKFNSGVIIQTNGIHIGRANTKVLEERLERLYEANPDVIVVIETSIKGSNRDEFALITQTDGSLYEFNTGSYYRLKEIGAQNLRPVIIAGFGVNESYLLSGGESEDRITVLFDKETPTYHPSVWDSTFEKLYEDFTIDYSPFDPVFFRMPMYGIKDQYAYNWVKMALRQGKEVFGRKLYDARYAERKNKVVEARFPDILERFFLRPNQDYYSLLIRR